MSFQPSAATRVFLSLFLLFLSSSLFAQKTVIGKISSSANNEPVAGASVQVRGTRIGTQTNADGRFSISVPKDNSVLAISGIGFTRIEIAVDGRTDIGEVTLVQTSSSLDQIVVTGYSTQRKRDITGAVTVLNTEEVKSQPAADVTSQLQGRASGVTVVQSGVPGAAATVRIRGLGSFNNNSPLYVIDGVETGSLIGLNPDDVETMQILKDAASASIYGVKASNGVVIITTKQAKKIGTNVSYSMYYGTQAPGKGPDLLNAQEAANLTFLAYQNSGQALPALSAYGTGATPVLPDYIYATGAASGPINNGNPAVNPSNYSLSYPLLGSAGYNPDIIVPASKGGTDWYKVITRNAPIQNHTLTLSGKSETARYLLSLNYFDQQAISQYQFYKRYSVRMNSEFTVTKGFRLGENLRIYGDESNVPPLTASSTAANPNNSEASIIAQSYRPMAIVPVYTIKPGDFAGNIGNSGFGTWGNAKNPLAQLYRTRNDRSNNMNLFGNAYAELDPIRHLTLRTSFGGFMNTQSAWAYPFIEYENTENVGNSTYNEANLRTNNWIWTNQAVYKNTIGKHTFSLLAGQEAQKSAGRQIIGGSTGFLLYSYQPFINLNNGNTQNLSGSFIFTPQSISSYFGKVDYAFDNKYIFSATIRRDGSSIFIDPYQYATFPAFSVGWRISDEAFMRSLTWINDLKVRGSWGKTGNIGGANPLNGYTTYAAGRTSSFYDINGTQTSPADGFYQATIGNPKGQWERDVQTNVGFDATLFRNSTNIVFDWYQKNTDGLLYNPALQAIQGAALVPFQNVGSMTNSGIDLMIDNRTILNRDWRLNTSFTFTSYRNKIKSITQNGQKFFDFNSPANEANRIGAPATRNMVGQAVNSFYGYQVLGLFQSAAEVTSSPTQADAAPGRFKYADITSPTGGKPDGQITPDDRTIIGNPNPKFTYGFNLGAEYKDFDITAFFYGVAGKDAFNLTRWWTDFSPGAFPGGRSKRALYDSWLPNGSRPHATVPIQEVSSGGGFSSNLAVSSYYVENASYFRLRTLQIGYTLPESLMRRVRLSKARIYIQGTNLFTITKYTGFDPDIISSDDRAASVDVGAYPTVRQFLVGANITFK
jgi:TonB-dependent starch-binding outer membrane protein SusC